MRSRRTFSLVWLLGAVLALVTFAHDAKAAGVFKLKSGEVTEVSGAWHVYVTIELTKPPLTAHQSMKFLFTKQVEYERTLVDNHEGPVLNRTVLKDQTPSVESLDVDFADPSGKIFKGTRFDFGLTRTRGYVAGEYKVELKTSDGTVIGSPGNLTLKGDNDVVDRRAMSFSAKEKPIKKVEGYDAGANQAKNDGNDTAANPMGGEVTPTGTAKPFVDPAGQQETEEEKIKTRPGGCGCSIPGIADPLHPGLFVFLVPLAGLGVMFARRRRSASVG